MNAMPRTDKERAQIAEARVAELEDELAAWRAYQPQLSSIEVPRSTHFASLVKTVIGSQHANGTARFLSIMAAHGGRICRHEMLVEHLGCGPETGLHVTKVYAHKARRVLRGLGLGNLIQTIWGEGYLVGVPEAAVLRSVIERARAA